MSPVSTVFNSVVIVNNELHFVILSGQLFHNLIPSLTSRLQIKNGKVYSYFHIWGIFNKLYVTDL